MAAKPKWKELRNWLKEKSVCIGQFLHSYHSSLASLVVAVIAALTANKITRHFEEAKLIVSLGPSLLSTDRSAQKLAYYLIKKHISETEASEIGKLLGQTFYDDSFKPIGIRTPLVEEKQGRRHSIFEREYQLKAPAAVATQSGAGTLLFSKPSTISEGGTFSSEKVTITGKPNLSGVFVYDGKELKITKVREYIGLLVSSTGIEGPVLMGVDFQLSP